MFVRILGGILVKKWLLWFSFLSLFILSSCSFQTPNPTDELNTYLNHWKNERFSDMYDMLSAESKEQYEKEEFIQRYEKIYEDISANELKFSYIQLSNDELKEMKQNKSGKIPLEVEMDSVAGIITFVHDIDLTYAEQNDEENWVIDWNPGLIFPELANGGKVQIDVEKPKRGEILDRNKMPLAINDIAYEIGIVPKDFESEENEKEEIARLLGTSVEKIDEKLDEPWVKEDFFIPLKVIPRSAEDTFKQLTQIPAVSYTETSGRTYPAGDAAAHLTGYVGKITSEEMKKHKDKNYKETDFIGKQGLELTFEETLRGEEGVKISVINEDKHKTTIAETPVKNGENIQLTIDINAQEKLFDSLEGNPGTAAAVDPKTGEVVAIVSSPGFNPNDFTYGITQANWDALMNDPLEPFVNRFAATYAPGSVMKTITAAVGLENGTIKPNDGLTINGLTWGKEDWGGQTVTRVSSSGGPVDLRDALVRSDNIYFAQQTVKMGSKKYVEGLKEYGFEEKLPLPISIRPSQISNDEEGIQDEILLAHTSYGQGEIEVSSLHVALTYTPILNNGDMVKPILLMSDKKGQAWKENVLSKDHAKELDEDLRDVVRVGTAKNINEEKFPIAGKTGTAELKSTKDGSGSENGWFVGYHAEDKDLVIALMAEKSENIGTSSYASKQVLKALKEIKKGK